MEPSPRDLTTARVLVAGQMVLLVALVVVPRQGHWPVPGWLLAAAAVGAVAGLAVVLVAGKALGRGLTAVPLPNRHATLRTGGLYGLVRHPVYAGLLLAAGSVAVAGSSWWRVGVLGLLVVLLNVKARFEERHLARRFEGYAAYARRTPRLVPRPWRRR